MQITEKEGQTMTLTQRIKEACDATAPRTKARMAALAQVRWVLRDQNGNYAGLTSDASIITVEDVKDAVVFDGRDNEEIKRRFYGSLTGLDYSVELV